MPSTAALTTGRDRLLDAAEKLMAERGTAAVSLREINAEAGQRNASAIQYHFENRQGLVAAVVARHMAGIDEERNLRLDELEGPGGPLDQRDLLGALVMPLAAKLDDASGRCYLRIIGQLATSSDADDLDVAHLNRSIERVADRLRGPRGAPQIVMEARTIQVTQLLLTALAQRARCIETSRADRRPEGHGLFVSNLIDVLDGVLRAPVSTETAHLVT